VARIRRTINAGFVALAIVIALATSGFLAYAASAPRGTASYPPPTTTTVKQTTTTTTPRTTTTVCKPGNGFGDKNHCHTGPPGQNKKP
jgi:hypothetical protein